MKGYIHSTESFGTVDGPGIRLVVFMQGCPMRCSYCHNPDTWQMNRGEEMTSDEIIALFMKNHAFYSSGGITVSGGEPLAQADFLLELFTKAKENNIHTCLDTSGAVYKPDDELLKDKIRKILKLTKLLMLDIKHIDPEKHKELTGTDNRNILAFAREADSIGCDICIRHVVVEGITDDPYYLKKLGSFIGSLRHLRYLDVLPYHTLGADKYKELGIAYPLEGTLPTTKEKALECRQYILEGIREQRKASAL